MAPRQLLDKKYSLLLHIDQRYEGHTFCTFELTINPSQEIYTEKNYQYKGHLPNVARNATHLICTVKYQRDGIAKVSKFLLLI